MSVSKVLDGFCLFCYRTYNISNKSNNGTDKVNNFVKFLGRFMNCPELENKLIKLELSECPLDLIMESCVDCQSATEKFCDVYNQIQYLELKLEWELEKIVKVIKLGSKVPSRISALNSILEQTMGNYLENGANVKNMIQKFRNIVVRKGKYKQCY